MTVPEFMGGGVIEFVNWMRLPCERGEAAGQNGRVGGSFTLGIRKFGEGEESTEAAGGWGGQIGNVKASV